MPFGLKRFTMKIAFQLIHFNPIVLEPDEEIYTIQNNELTLADYIVSGWFIHYYKRVK